MWAEAAFAVSPWASGASVAEDAPPRRGGGAGAGAGPMLHANVNGRTVRGTRQQIEALLRQLAQQHAEEDEETLETEQKPKRRTVRVTAPESAQVSVQQQTGRAQVTVLKPLLREAGITAEQAAAVYEQAYARHLHRVAIAADDEEVAELMRHAQSHRQQVGKTLLDQLNTLLATMQ